ncbi:NtaA/DmoA family FMN-dependent monooxygenase [Acetobacter oeni]|uniref:Monooxygenase n=1 Tax=Acetobacter oeni TaxID=304077 RepID=A0A511XH33_9PROT|nr:NtaA/DmoA family FMN-dependent monooxygenase [Acetobacter oeni]MBB3882404.1 FMN-dependent oxidoreductase (nitrilotriacetate monooxygenase family) [Acetobacter oeni]NHO18497.1 NtaA/DmoA family FMN-dependent monooxygenase [Acetobacter oeni]GBR09422.1 putative monooxygenase [Acetobacter oeni LMG 21952]GEN62262.1 monooxygenase [Acetobacter oeni]
MTKKQLRLGLVPSGVGGPGAYNRWLDPEIPADASVNIDWYVDVARQAEDAKFDWIFIVDSQFITPQSPPHYLSRLEPLTLLSALAVVTRHIGLAGTLSTSYNDPFSIARRLASLDLISHGRAGWNVVTTGDAGTAGNFSLEEHYDYETRHARAAESIDVIRGLWRSYEEGSLPRDREQKKFLNPDKLRQLNHKGKYFSVTGPLNIERSPQGEPVIFQAGDSVPGRDLGAHYADVIFTHATTLEKTRRFREDLRERASRAGRNPDSVLIAPGIKFVIGDTDEHARDIARHYNATDHSFEQALGEFGRLFGWHDFTRYDPDAPFPDDVLKFAERSWYTSAKKITEQAISENLTLRQVIEQTQQGNKSAGVGKGSPFIGSAATVADKITEWFEKGAFDAVNIYLEHPSQFRRLVSEVLPRLRERGIIRDAYTGTTLRDNLGLDPA